MAYIASKSQSQGRPGFSILFRHPLRKDKHGKPGLKVRRGLNTSDSDEAEELVTQMNTILSDESWWNAARRSDAQSLFGPVVVDAFFGDIQAGWKDSAELRDTFLPLPTKSEGYAHVLFVGTTGAGKTSLLRHCIGSDPNEDRFPSTSTAKTTVSDIEVIPQEGNYRAVVTFFSEFSIRANVEDCLRNACIAVWENLSDDRIAEEFLNHPDQRFRLSYTLGSWRAPEIAVEEDDWSFGDEEEQETGSTEENVAHEETRKNRALLEEFIHRITDISTPIIMQTIADFGSPAALSGDDAAAAQDIFLEQVEEAPAFIELVFDVMTEVVKRFDYLSAGELHRPRSSSEWPDYWTYDTENRDDFIRNIRWFSSNFAPSFGRLLTPLVDGIRISGPLYPDFIENEKPRVVLIDGQGLGHTADSAATVTTHITKRFEAVDVILLVDNAQQPIQAAAQAVLRAAASSGHYGKLAIAFTHFDQVKGANLPTAADKKNHVLASVNNYLLRLKEALSAAVVNSMGKALESQCFMLGGLNMTGTKLPKAIKAELNRLFAFFGKSIEAAPLPETHPIYDLAGIGFAVQRATDVFQRVWSARLSLAYISGISSDHWTRVKALTRRIASEMDVEYDTLQPVADLVGRMADEVSNYLDNPLKWTRAPLSEEEAQEAISAVRRKVYAALHDLVSRRIIDDHLNDWRSAWDRSGKGSTTRRATDIRSIYESAAPIPGTVNTSASLALLTEMRTIVGNAIQESGGQLQMA